MVATSPPAVEEQPEKAEQPAAAQPEATPERRIRLSSFTLDDAFARVGAGAGALAFDWLLYERVLPFSGALGFWLGWYVLFLIGYAAIAGMLWGRRVVSDRLATVVFVTAGLYVLAVILDQIGYTIFRGEPALRHLNFFTHDMAGVGPSDPLTKGGAYHAIIGSLEQLGIATAISVPLSLITALYLAEIGGALARPVRTIVEAMTALPDIIAGLVIYASFILVFHLPHSGLAVSLSLTIMMIPYVTRSAEVMLRLVPDNLREASYALGASQWRTVVNVVLPTARSGLTTAIVLGMARAVGETAPVLIVSGWTDYTHWNPTSGNQNSLPLYIWVLNKYPQQVYHDRSWGAGLVLIVIVLILFTIARVFGGRNPGELTRRQRRRIARDMRGKSQ
jgi:phosphate transport system permease protein